MIREIDGLKLPCNLEGKVELKNMDTTRRTVSGRLITKLASSEKWQVTISYESISMSLSFQKKFYEKCLELRGRPGSVWFTSPYDGSEVTIVAKCVSRSAPSALSVGRGLPALYKKVGAVFEEV